MSEDAPKNDNLKRRIQMFYQWSIDRVPIPPPGQTLNGEFQAPPGMRLAQVVTLGREQPKVMAPGGKISALVMMIYEGAGEVTEPAVEVAQAPRPTVG